MESSNTNNFKAQMTKVFVSFSERPKTMLMVSIETGIRRSNITRFISKWKRQNKISVLYFGICPKSKRAGVQFLTTDKTLFQTIKA